MVYYQTIPSGKLTWSNSNISHFHHGKLPENDHLFNWIWNILLTRNCKKQIKCDILQQTQRIYNHKTPEMSQTFTSFTSFLRFSKSTNQTSTLKLQTKITTLPISSIPIQLQSQHPYHQQFAKLAQDVDLLAWLEVLLLLCDGWVRKTHPELPNNIFGDMRWDYEFMIW